MGNKTKNFVVKYKAGHSCNETWSKTDYYCPKCGAQSVWQDTSGGDVDVGPELICESPNCRVSFYLPSGVNAPPSNDWQAKQRRIEITKSTA